jgi:type II secretory pathway pseudopilin PulG
MSLNRILAGVIVLLVALLLVTSSVAALYYGRYQDQTTETSSYVRELKTALTEYNQLSSSYYLSLTGFNRTIALLTNALSNLNSSTPAYLEGSQALGALWNQYLALASESGTSPVRYTASMLIDFGNGTSRSFTGKAIQPGWNAYITTLAILNGSVQATWYPEYQEHYVTAIDGVSSGKTTAWFVWSLNGTEWEVAPTGADAVQVYNGTTFAWTLCGYDQSFKPTCTP